MVQATFLVSVGLHAFEDWLGAEPKAALVGLELFQQTLVEQLDPLHVVHHGTHRVTWASQEPEALWALASAIRLRHPAAKIACHAGALTERLDPLRGRQLPYGIEVHEVEALWALATGGQILITRALMASLPDHLHVQEHGALSLCGTSHEIFELTLHTHGVEAAPMTTAARIERTRASVHDALTRLRLEQDPSGLATLVGSLEEVTAVVELSKTHAPKVCEELLVHLSYWIHPVWKDPICIGASEALWEEGGPDLWVLRARHLRVLGRLEEATEILTSLLEPTRATPTLHAVVLYELASGCMLVQELEQASAYADALLSWAHEQELGAELILAHQCHAATKLYLQANPAHGVDIKDAFDSYEVALTLAQRKGDLQLSLRLLGELGNLLSRYEPLRAEGYLEEALALAETLELPAYQSVTVGLLADLCIHDRRFRQARAWLAQAEALCPPDEHMMRWFLLQQRGLVALMQSRFADGMRHVEQMRELGVESLNPMAAPLQLFMRALCVVGAGLPEPMRAFLPEVQPPELEARPMLRVVVCLARVMLEPCAEHHAALLERFEQLSGNHDREWLRVVWSLGVANVPELLASSPEPTLLVAPDFSWFQLRGEARVPVGHRPYIHNLFRALVRAYQDDVPGLDTLTMFEAGWPGERASLDAYKNRVYVGVSHLRKLGLGDWLVRGPHGYVLSRGIEVVMMREGAALGGVFAQN